MAAQGRDFRPATAEILAELAEIYENLLFF